MNDLASPAVYKTDDTQQAPVEVPINYLGRLLKEFVCVSSGNWPWDRVPIESRQLGVAFR